MNLKTRIVMKLKTQIWWNSKTEIVMKQKNWNCDKLQKLKLWWNSKIKRVIKLKKDSNGTKLKSSSCDKTQKLILWHNSKIQIVTKLELWQNSNWDKSQCVTNLKLWEKKTQNVTTLKLWQNSRTHIWENSQTKIVKKLKNTNCDKSQFIKKKKFQGSFGNNILTPWQPMRYFMASVLQFLLFVWIFFYNYWHGSFQTCLPTVDWGSVFYPKLCIPEHCRNSSAIKNNTVYWIW